MAKAKAIECPEYDTLVKGMEEARAKAKEAGKAAVGALFKAFFAAHPKITAVGWTQYTPHFNDGDACVFGLHSFYGCTKSGVNFAEVTSLYDSDEDAIFHDTYEMKGAAKAAVEMVERSADSDLFEAAFGDHVMVIATPEGFHVSEYSHD